jgi:hypothetical protein
LFRERSHFDQTVIRLGLFAAIAPEDAHCWRGFAEAIVKVVDAPFGKRTFPRGYRSDQDGAEVAFAVVDRVRTEMLHRVRL